MDVNKQRTTTNFKIALIMRQIPPKTWALYVHNMPNRKVYKTLGEQSFLQVSLFLLSGQSDK